MFPTAYRMQMSLFRNELIAVGTAVSLWPNANAAYLLRTDPAGFPSNLKFASRRSMFLDVSKILEKLRDRKQMSAKAGK
jgi:hypothetical protein